MYGGGIKEREEEKASVARCVGDDGQGDGNGEVGCSSLPQARFDARQELQGDCPLQRTFRDLG